jgi:hypothetical protein
MLATVLVRKARGDTSRFISHGHTIIVVAGLASVLFRFRSSTKASRNAVDQTGRIAGSNAVHQDQKHDKRSNRSLHNGHEQNQGKLLEKYTAEYKRKANTKNDM